MTEDEKPGFTRSGLRFNAQGPSLAVRILTALLGAAFLFVAFMFSLVVLAVAVSAGLLAWGYIWWKSRKLHRQMREQIREQMREQRSEARIIEGEVIREGDAGDKLLH